MAQEENPAVCSVIRFSTMKMRNLGRLRAALSYSINNSHTDHFWILTIYVSYYCCNKLPQIWRLKVTHHLTVAEARMGPTGLKSKCQWGRPPLKALREKASHASASSYELPTAPSSWPLPPSEPASHCSKLCTAFRFWHSHSQGPCDSPGPESSRTISRSQDLNLTTTAVSLLPDRATHPQAPQWGRGSLWGTIILPTTPAVFPTMINGKTIEWVWKYHLQHDRGEFWGFKFRGQDHTVSRCRNRIQFS